MFESRNFSKKRDSTKENKELQITNSDRQRTLFLRSLLSQKSVSSDTSHHIDFEYNIEDNTIIEHFRSVERRERENKLELDIDKHALNEIREGNCGVIDLNNDQHVELLYCFILHRAKHHLRDSQTPRQEQGTENEKWQNEKLASPDVQNTYKTAFLGAGASIAYYIESLGRGFDHRTSIIMGTPQPWGGERGAGVLATPEYMVTPKRQLLRATGIDDEWIGTERFSELVEGSLNRFKDQR
jgi:hypothetical protein